jgi:tetratricopeptide (TPR) repeat protein
MHATRWLQHWVLLSLILLSMLGCQGSIPPDQPPKKYKFPPLVWAKALVDLIKPAVPDTAAGLEKQALYFQTKGQYDLAEKHYRQALTIRETGWGAEHFNVVPSLEALAAYYTARGQYEQIEPLLRRDLAIREKAQGPQHADVAATLDKYVALLRQTGRTAEAISLEQRAQAIRGNK